MGVSSSYSGGTQPAAAGRAFQPGLLGLLVMACGVGANFTISGVGELFWAELLLLPLAIGQAAIDWPTELFSNRHFRALMLAAFLMLVGYIISDLHAGTPPSLYWRGWSRVAALIANIFSFSILCHRSKWLIWWYWLGWALAAIALAMAAHMPVSVWKLGYGDSFTVLAATATAFLPLRVAAIVLIVVGGLNVMLDYRSLGVTLLLSSAALAVRRKEQARVRRAPIAIKLVALGSLALGATAMLLSLSNDVFSQRREVSNINRLAALQVGAIAIANSPLVGYGSWGQGTEEYATMLYRRTLGNMVDVGAGQMARQSNTLLAHSQIIQAWMEGGLLAAAFFFVYGYLLLSRLRYLIVTCAYDPLKPLFLVLLLNNLWHLVMSPFLGPHRLNIASAAAIAVYLSLENRLATQTKVLPAALRIAPPNLMS